MTISPSELTRPDRHIFLSPHYDDIALSCGGTAATLASAGRTPEVALIFGDHPDPAQPMTAFADALHRQWGMSAAEVIAGRRAEESVASMALGTCDRFLPFRDAIYRGERYTSDNDLFGTVHPDESEIPGQIIEHLRLCTDGASTTRIYAPLAVGSHVDHQHAYHAGLELIRRGWDVWFYEDLPYALRPENVAARRPILAGDGIQAGPAVDVRDAWNRKIDAIMAYPSQLATIFGQYVGIGSTRSAIDESMREYAVKAGSGVAAERFWAANG
ncbi:MAG: PIG-L family deacetylase [Chloroflexota bacterium]|nr:PIG-L family deacetylase [Chloroflexota bacterium]